MALATRCPHCQTTFRVAQDQLKLRAGLVRCGACREIFNAVEHLVRLDAAPPIPQPPETPRSPPPAVKSAPPVVPAAPPTEPATQEMIPAAPPEPPPQPEPEEAPIAPEPAAEQPAPPSVAEEPANQQTPDKPEEFADFSEFLSSSSSEPVEAEAPAPAADIEPESDPLTAITLVQMGELPDEEPEEVKAPAENAPTNAATETSSVSDSAVGEDETAEVHHEVPPPAGPVRRKSLDELRPGYRAPETPQEADDETPEDEEPEFVRLGRRKQRLARISRLVFSLGSVLLLAALIFQGGYAFRNVLAASFPQTRANLASVCSILRCRVELPTQIDQVTIESSELQSQPNQEGTLALNMLLRNHSQIVQAWPSIELTLNDSSDKPIVRRVLSPRDYLPRAIDPAKGFPRYSEQAVTVNLDVSQIKPEGYHLYIFYP